MPNAAEPSLSLEVERVLRSTAPGEVLTYAEVAALCGRPGAARAVGRVLASSQGLPWWRVVDHRGRLVPGHERRQAELLAKEGLETSGGRLPLPLARGRAR